MHYPKSYDDTKFITATLESINESSDICRKSIKLYDIDTEIWSDYLEIKWFEHIISDRIIDFIDIIKQTNYNKYLPILDAGCGPGHSTNYLRIQGLNPRDVDTSIKFLKLARKRYEGIPFLNDDIRLLNQFKENEFVAVIAPFSVIYIPENPIIIALNSMNRVLTKGGHIYLSVDISSEDTKEYTAYETHPISNVPSFRHIFSKTILLNNLKYTGFEII